MSARVTRLDWHSHAFDEIARWPTTAAHMAVCANAVAEAAQQNAPVKRGKLSGGFSATAALIDNEGAYAQVTNSWPGAVPAEVGSINNPPYGMTSQAIRGSGLKWHEGRS